MFWFIGSLTVFDFQCVAFSFVLVAAENEISIRSNKLLHSAGPIVIFLSCMFEILANWYDIDNDKF